MELRIILQTDTIEECKTKAEEYLKAPLQVIPEKLSIFESYIIRPAEHRFIPKVWTYRIVCRNKKYYFGTI